MIHNIKYWLNGTLYFNLWQSSIKVIAPINSKIYRCDITSLKIDCTHLKIQELDKLLSSKNLIELYLIRCNVADSDGTDITLDNLLKKVPNISRFSYIKPHNTVATNITNETVKNLIKIFNVNSVTDFAVSGFASQMLKLDMFCEFIKNAAAPKASFRFFLNYSLPDQKKILQETMTQMLDGLKEKPFIHFFNYF